MSPTDPGGPREKDNTMNITKKLAAAVTGTVVAAAIGVGSMASAAAVTETSVPSKPAVSVQAKCDREPAITARYDKAHANLSTRLTKLQARHDKAVAAGHDKAAARLERLIKRVQKLDTRITTKYQRYETWVQANCKA
jgi:hypothetical protein